MAKRIYVGNLPFNTVADEMKELFLRFGYVRSVHIVTDPHGRSKGFGFVEMTDDQAVAAAIDRLDGIKFNGRPLVIKEARPIEGKNRA
jgi:RNA recognition motif-containing protein